MQKLSEINETYYLKKALEMAKLDLKNEMDKFNKYCTTIDKTKPFLKQYEGYFELQKQNYDPIEAIERRVKLEIAIRNLSSTLFFKDRNNKF
jgi:hypothetical protein